MLDHVIMPKNASLDISIVPSASISTTMPTPTLVALMTSVAVMAFPAADLADAVRRSDAF